jgi:hypothetical protein
MLRLVLLVLYLIGGGWDPNGSAPTGDTGGGWDPNGSLGDIGGGCDPNG